jgi:ABC-type oligopeptide transport system substrate-binding subunit
MDTTGSGDIRTGAAFLESVVFESIPPSWRSSDVRDAVERVNRLAGDKRRSAAAALADRLVVRDVPVIPYGNRVNGELFSPTVGCRVFSPVSNGVDLAALCRSERP